MKRLITIGKDLSNDIVLHDKLAEQFHSHVECLSDGLIKVKDLESRFGTLVNGKKIKEEILNAGDDLQIGFVHIDWQNLFQDLASYENSDALLESEPEQNDLEFMHESKNGKTEIIDFVLPEPEIPINDSYPPLENSGQSTLSEAREETKKIEDINSEKERTEVKSTSIETAQGFNPLPKKLFKSKPNAVHLKAYFDVKDALYAFFAIASGLLGGYLVYLFT
jgi:pSer/pThr/pTyr-binding forkhead associated (FHA) protein